MYAVRRWDEEVIKWLAVGMVAAMIGMAVMPNVGITNIAGVVAGIHAGYHASSVLEAAINGAYEGLLASTIPLAVYFGVLAVSGAGPALAVGLAVAV